MPPSKVKRKSSLVVPALVLVGALVWVLLGSPSWSDLEAKILGEGTSSSSTQEVAASDKYYEVVGTAEREHDAREGQVDYCPLDKLERSTCAYGLLTYEMRAGLKGKDREDITEDPSGWGHNTEVEIFPIGSTDKKEAYHGWLYNRSHLVADSLGGSPSMENMITGTRMQNVGFNGANKMGDGGMAYTEVAARDYLQSEKSKDCPLYYAADPNYEGDELLPRTVTVDIQSCDKTIDERVVVPNTANGFEINYQDGSFTKTG